MANEIKLESGADFRNQRGINLADPISATDLVNLQTLQAYLRGITSVKDAVRVATTVAGTLATSFANGQTIDGVVLITNDRILLKNQVAGADNGIYTVNGAGAPTRSTDADASAEVKDGMTVAVAEGTVNQNHVFMLTTSNPITLGSTALVFADFGQGTIYTAGNGLTGTTTFTVLADGGSLTVSASGVKVTPGVVAYIYGTGTHAGTATVTVTHNLNTKRVVWSCQITSTGEFIYPAAFANNVNSVDFIFGNAPSLNTLTFTING